MANTPGSPDDTSATRHPARARARAARARSASAPIVPRTTSWSGRTPRRRRRARSRRPRRRAGWRRWRPASGGRRRRGRARRRATRPAPAGRGRRTATAAVAVAPLPLGDARRAPGPAPRRAAASATLGVPTASATVVTRVGDVDHAPAAPPGRYQGRPGGATTAGWPARRSMVATRSTGRPPAGRPTGPRRSRRAPRRRSPSDEHPMPHDHDPPAAAASPTAGASPHATNTGLSAANRTPPSGRTLGPVHRRPAPGCPGRRWAATARSTAANVATRRPPGAGRRRQASRTSSPPPPTKTRSGTGRPARAAGAAPSTTSTTAPEGGGVGDHPLGVVGSALDGDHPQAGSGQRRLDGDAAAAGTDVPQHAVGGQVEPAQHDRPHLGLGDHPRPVGEAATGRPRSTDAAGSDGAGDGWASDHHRPVVERPGGQVGQVGAARRPARRLRRGGWPPRPAGGGRRARAARADRLGRGVGPGARRPPGPGHLGRGPGRVAGVARADDGGVPRQAEAGEREGDRRRRRMNDQPVPARRPDLPRRCLRSFARASAGLRENRLQASRAGRDCAARCARNGHRRPPWLHQAPPASCEWRRRSRVAP